MFNTKLPLTIAKVACSTISVACTNRLVFVVLNYN